MTTAPRTSLESIRVLRLNRDAVCACGEDLRSGERVGYDLLVAEPLCLRCTAAAQREGRITPTEQVARAEGQAPSPVSELEAEARREVCRIEVALWRANQDRLEAAYATGAASVFRTTVRTRLHATALAVGRGLSRLGSPAQPGRTA